MKVVARITILTALAASVAGCSASWDAQIINDLSAALRIEVTGPGRCSISAELPAETTLSFKCRLRDGVTIKFTNSFGQTCIAGPEEVKRSVEDGDTGPIWHEKFLFIRLSHIPCGRNIR